MEVVNQEWKQCDCCKGEGKIEILALPIIKEKKERKKQALPEMKTCGMCGEEKSRADDYYKAGRGVQPYCKSCLNSRKKQYYKKRPNTLDKLETEKKEAIRVDLDLKMKVKPVAVKHGISYMLLLKWIKNGDI